MSGHFNGEKMKAFFTRYKEKEIHENSECDAIDIIAGKYTIRIRGNGILVKDNKTQEEILDKNFDLRDRETITKKKPKSQKQEGLF